MIDVLAALSAAASPTSSTIAAAESRTRAMPVWPESFLA